ncbi:MAG: uroporphyrinogen decarboxylase family protein [FCB group bacterium]|nr:uroporphyrinogen decarboxylase family protein [FCB group bacterium]
MTSLERVLTTLQHKEPDRVPLFLLLSLHGAKELGLSIEEYFSKAEHVVEGQLKLRDKYKLDCIYNFYYAAVEVEVWGGDVRYIPDGPPNSGTPFIRNPDDIKRIKPPLIKHAPCLQKVLQSCEMLKMKVGDDAPIIGVVISPFSVPVMQMGFDKYLELMYDNSGLFDQLMTLNETFCVEWANAQLEAGATAIVYFDPVSSPSMVPREFYLETGYKIAQRTLSQINGPTATHLASGRGLPIVDDVARTGTQILGVSVLEDLATIKQACKNKLTVLGNLNGVEMRRWTEDQTIAVVKDCIAKAGPGGGFILADNHGEIPWQVSDDVLSGISRAVQEWGHYPLEWINENGD